MDDDYCCVQLCPNDAYRSQNAKMYHGQLLRFVLSLRSFCMRSCLVCQTHTGQCTRAKPPQRTWISSGCIVPRPRSSSRPFSMLSRISFMRSR